MTPLMVDDVLYTTAGSQVYALDSQTGRVIWHYLWQSPAGAQLGRGVAILEGRLYVQTGTDNFVVCLDRHTGHELWRRQVTDAFGYAGSTAPVLAGNHLVLGMGGDGNNVAPWLEARDPRSGDVQWRWYTTPRGSETGMESWPNEDTAKHGEAWYGSRSRTIDGSIAFMSPPPIPPRFSTGTSERGQSIHRFHRGVGGRLRQDDLALSNNAA